MATPINSWVLLEWSGGVKTEQCLHYPSKHGKRVEIKTVFGVVLYTSSG